MPNFNELLLDPRFREQFKAQNKDNAAAMEAIALVEVLDQALALGCKRISRGENTPIEIVRKHLVVSASHSIDQQAARPSTNFADSPFCPLPLTQVFQP
ncbi:MAG TPA: hypothetical protein V6D22_13260 [Candidatus Obscuribacterales bacterium]